MLTKLRKLKKQFITTSMVLVGAMILAVFVAVCVITYRATLRRFYTALSDTLAEQIRAEEAGQEETDPVPYSAGGGWDDERDASIPLPSFYIYTVRVLPDGTILSRAENPIEMDEQTLTAAVRAALSREKNRGELREFQLLFFRVEHKDEVRVAFASGKAFHSTMQGAYFITGGAFFGMLLLFYLICRLVAGIVVRPVEEAWTSQEQFIADASHDLKTPLTVILADAAILRSEAERGASDLRWIDGIREEAEHMSTLVERMLEVARTESLKGTLTLVSEDLSELTEQAALQLEPIAFEKRIALETEIRPHVIFPTDRETYTRLLYILIDNAVKYSDEGGRVILRLGVEKQYVRVSVENGGSIAAGDLSRIFERFYRADKARSVGGSGLGLSIAKNLAEALGGELIAESKSGEERTVFSVLFRRSFLSEIAATPESRKKES